MSIKRSDPSQKGALPKMKTAGIDIGHHTAKAVIMEDGKVVSQASHTMSIKSSLAAEKILDEALEPAGFSRDEIDYIVATGHGRKGVSIAHDGRALATCLAKAAHWLFPTVRTAIDVGAEVCSVVEMNEYGRVVGFQENDKCAAGSGIFFESMSGFLKMSLEEMSDFAQKSKNPISFNSQCVVFSEQELITYIHSENPTPEEDLVAGIFKSLASRLVGLARRVKIREDLLLSGGTARSPAFAKAMEKEFGLKLTVPEKPENVMALGAALFAGELCTQGG